MVPSAVWRSAPTGPSTSAARTPACRSARVRFSASARSELLPWCTAEHTSDRRLRHRSHPTSYPASNSYRSLRIVSLVNDSGVLSTAGVSVCAEGTRQHARQQHGAGCSAPRCSGRQDRRRWQPSGVGVSREGPGSDAESGARPSRRDLQLLQRLPLLQRALLSCSETFETVRNASRCVCMRRSVCVAS